MSIGSLYAEYNLAKMYRYGQYVEKNFSRYEQLLRSVYAKYKRYNIAYCPLRLLFDMSESERQSGNTNVAVECCLQALNIQKMQLTNGYGIVNEDFVDIICQLYRLIEFDPNDMHLLDLLYIMNRSCSVLIVCKSKRITVESFDSKGRVIVQCEKEYFRDAVDFLNRYVVGNIPISQCIDDIDYMEILS